jgi:hypothetical protein
MPSMKRSILLRLRSLATLSVLLAANFFTTAQAQEPAPATPAAPAAAAAEPLKVGEFTFKAPDPWKTKGTPRPMSQGGFSLLTADGTKTIDADFYHFGAGEGGAIEANVSRWKGQFQPAEGTEAIKFERKQYTFGQRKATLVFIKGTFLSGGMFAAKTPQPGSAMIGAILESEQGNVFVKFTGPEKDVDASKDAFMKLLGTAYPDPAAEAKVDAAKVEDAKLP